MNIKLTRIPSSGYCWDYKENRVCPYFNNDGGHNKCIVFEDALGINARQEKTCKVIIGICYWKKQVCV